MLSKQQFERARHLVMELAGIELLPRHQDAMGRRAQRLGITDSAAWDLLFAEVEAGKTEARQKILRLILTHFTEFFRHPDHFELAAAHLLRAAQSRGTSTCWCAGVATGEEPYSLTMKLLELCGEQSPPVTILATELEPGVLEFAKRGEYDEKNLNSVPLVMRERFLLHNPLSRRWCLSPLVRRMVEFRSLNLAEPRWSLQGTWDIIFCRNVIMYMTEAARCSVLERMAALLKPDGLLILDPSEHPGRAEALFTAGTNGVFRPRLTEARNGFTFESTPIGCPRMKL